MIISRITIVGIQLTEVVCVESVKVAFSIIDECYKSNSNMIGEDVFYHMDQNRIYLPDELIEDLEKVHREILCMKEKNDPVIEWIKIKSDTMHICIRGYE